MILTGNKDATAAPGAIASGEKTEIEFEVTSAMAGKGSVSWTLAADAAATIKPSDRGNRKRYTEKKTWKKGNNAVSRTFQVVLDHPGTKTDVKVSATATRSGDPEAADTAVFVQVE